MKVHGAGFKQQAIREGRTPAGLQVVDGPVPGETVGLWRTRRIGCVEMTLAVALVAVPEIDLLLRCGLPRQSEAVILLIRIQVVRPTGIGCVERDATIRSADILAMIHVEELAGCVHL